MAHLVLLVVAGEVGEYAGGAGDDVDVGRPQQLHQALHQVLHVVDLGACVRQVPERPQAVLHQALAGVSQVDGQGLHAAGVHDRGLVAGAHGQDWRIKKNKNGMSLRRLYRR